MAWPTSSYPTSIDTITNKIDNTDTVIAADVNGTYSAIIAIETKLGTTTPSAGTIAYLLTSTSSDNPGHKHSLISYTMNYQDNIIQRPVIKDYGESINSLGTLSASPTTIDLTLGNVVHATLGINTTFIFSNASASGTACSFTLILVNSGGYTVTWPTTVKWSGGVAPTLTATGTDIFTFVTILGGATTWYGMIASLDAK
jgi:hypothetical protein